MFQFCGCGLVFACTCSPGQSVCVPRLGVSTGVSNVMGFLTVRVGMMKDFIVFKLMKGKALRKHSMHEKKAASVLLKPFISSNE